MYKSKKSKKNIKNIKKVFFSLLFYYFSLNIVFLKITFYF